MLACATVSGGVPDLNIGASCLRSSGVSGVAVHGDGMLHGGLKQFLVAVG